MSDPDDEEKELRKSSRLLPSPRTPRHVGRAGIPTFAEGWYALCAASDIELGEVLPAKLCGEDVVVFRTDSGPIVLDAFCPHLGAHLGYGGQVDGPLLRCPFHKWGYDQHGQCASVPYRDHDVPKVGVRRWPTMEQHGMLLVHFDPEGRAPTWVPEPMPELSEGTWSPLNPVSRDIAANGMDVIENLADPVHFRFVHETSTIPEVDVSTDGPVYRLTMTGILEDGSQEYQNYFTGWGLGLMRLFMPSSQMVVLTTATPIDEYTTRFTLWFTSKEGDGAMNLARREWLQETLAASTYRDVPLWEHRRYPTTPRLLNEDRHLVAVQRWAQQFYRSTGARTG